MGSWTGVVLLPKPLTADQSGDVEETLRAISEGTCPTRKGRHWTALIGNSWYSIDVESSVDSDPDIEEFLLKRDLDTSAVRELLIVNSPTKAAGNRDIVERLCQRLAERLNGWTFSISR